MEEEGCIKNGQLNVYKDVRLQYKNCMTIQKTVPDNPKNMSDNSPADLYSSVELIVFWDL